MLAQHIVKHLGEDTVAADALISDWTDSGATKSTSIIYIMSEGAVA